MTKTKAYKPTVIDLFSGCGGLSLGFEMAGFKTVLACDFWPPACLTFKKNFPDCYLLEKDIRRLTKSFLEEKIKKADLVIGGPPCQGFSIAGKQWLGDPRNMLFMHFLRVVYTIKPKFLVLENVPPILTLANGRFFKEIVTAFKCLDYQMKANILNSRFYGVPQERKRAIFLGWQKGLKEPKFPEPKALPYVTCKEAISDLENEEFSNRQKYHAQAQSEYQIWSRGDSRKLFNHLGSTISLLNQRRAAEVKQGQNEAKLPGWLKLKSRRINPKLKNISTGFRRLEVNKASPTIIRASGLQSQPLHYRFNRQLTVRELARLCSFPDSFIFYGNIRNQKGQIGNAVPPLLALAIAKEIKKVF